MVIKLSDLIGQLAPEKTVLFFGAGSAIPSGSPSALTILNKVRTEFGISNDTLNLQEVTLLAELKSDRARLISCIRKLFGKARATGGLVNLPLYDWKSIYTTNYDELVESAYGIRNKVLIRYTTNFDFSQESLPTDQRYYKIHGTIGQDTVDGSKGRIIITQKDYDQAEEYRDFLYQRFAADLGGSDLVVIGYSLSDPDIKSIVDKALSIQIKLGHLGGRVFLLMYERDEERAALFESRGLKVAFGSVDEFFAALASRQSISPDTETCEGLLDQYPRLRAITIDVNHARTEIAPEFSRMFNGSPASYADIAAGSTFVRQVTERMITAIEQKSEMTFLLLGASGVGKTTAARQVAISLEEKRWNVWEHQTDFDIQSEEWTCVARDLETLNEDGLLLIDNAHMQIHQINDLVDKLRSDSLSRLRILLISTRRQWLPRYKSPLLSRSIDEFNLSRLSSTEVDRLIVLVDRNDTIRPLVEKVFGGYTAQERRRRLIDRCSSDMFVCLRNIFATEKFDDIILREFGELSDRPREIYRVVSAMENSGIRVHRQLIIRLLSIKADQTESILESLDEIVSEYTISERDGVYGWRVRHPVIASIIVKYKFFDQSKIIGLFRDVISVLSPTYDIERQTLREICNVETGIPSISDKREQNTLLRQMISVAPGERVPRHRLIRNLIELNDFDIADTEIRLFDKDLGRDGPVARYQVSLLLSRAREAPGLLEEDRLVILTKARDLAVGYVERFQQNRMVHGAYCDVGIEWYKITGNLDVFDEAIKNFKATAKKLDDPEMHQMIGRYERRVSGDDLFDERRLANI